MPTLTREVVKQRQKTTVNKISTAVSTFMAKADDAFASFLGLSPSGYKA